MDDNSLDNTRLPLWTQPERPEWVRKLNEEGAYLDMQAVVPLDEDSLISHAKDNTGLEYFGDDPWREPFRTLIKSLDEEAELTLIGRLLTRSDLLMFLEARLRIEDAYLRHPEIDDEVIDKPIFIIGQGRSGSTYLQKLMELPPENRTMVDVEGMFPVPLGDGPDLRREIAFNRMRMWSRVTPQVAALHDFGADTTCETIRFEAFSFRCPAWLNLLGVTPSFNASLAGESCALPLGYAKRVLKLLQWQTPGFQWVLKSPDALLYLPDVLKVFPDARFVWGHRDPIKAMSSMVDMIGTMMFIRSDQKLSAAYESITNPALAAAMLTRPIDFIEGGLIPPGRLCNIQYEDLMADPVGAVRQIYEFYSMDFTPAAEAAIEKYVREHPRSSRPPHVYSHGDDSQISAERRAFKPYQDYFRVPNEF
ncbi:MAG: sulfotransferase [Caulobacterales bacterium]